MTMDVQRDQVGVWNGRSIPAFYAGTTFRSRTEARWAVFFDHLGIRWSYESEGFELLSGRYVPDFWLPDVRLWVEVKATYEERFSKVCAELADITRQRVVLLAGQPIDQDSSTDGAWYKNESGYMHFPDGGADQHYLWCVCPDCGRPGLEFDGRGARVCRDKCESPSGKHGDRGYTFDHPRILEAIRASNVWRFH